RTYQETVHSILQTLLHLLRRPGDTQAQPGLPDPAIAAKLRESYPRQPPRALLLDLNHGLTHGYDAVESRIFEDLLQLLDSGVRLAVTAENPLEIPSWPQRIRLAFERFGEARPGEERWL